MTFTVARPGFALGELLAIRNYRLLCAGQGLSLLGEQVGLIALSWLALQITENALALGSVLAAAGLPSALLMLASGVITDRFSARTILMLAEGLRLVVVCALVVLILSANVSLATLYAVALGFGLLTALAMPAAGAIVPFLVPRTALQPANSLYQSLAQLAAFAGSALAGAAIAAGGGARAAGSTLGPSASAATLALVPAFVIYAIGLAVSVVTLRMMRLPPSVRPDRGNERPRVLEAIACGWRYAWKDPLLRRLLPAILVANLLLAGPLAVGVPVLVRLRLPEGAAAFGFIMAGLGGGNLLGAVSAGSVRQSRGLGLLFCALFVTFGAGLVAFIWIRSTWLGFLILFVMGAGNGYLGVILRTLLHRRTPAQLLGRVMSVYFFARTLLVPLSQTISGAVVDASLDVLFMAAGALFAVLAAWFALSSTPSLFEQEIERARKLPAAGAQTG